MQENNLSRKIEKITWFRYAQRFSSDFPLLFVNYFFEGQKKYLGLKRLLYINKGGIIYAYRDKAEFEIFYNRIKNLKKKDFLKIAQETKDATHKISNILKKIASPEKLSEPELLKIFEKFNKCFYKFAAFFIYVQYIGQVYKDDPKILKYFDKEVIRVIRVSPLIPEIKKKLKLYFRKISHKLSTRPNIFFWLFPKEIKNILRKGLDKQLLQQAESRKKFYLLILIDGRKFFYTNENKNAIEIAEKLLALDKSVNITSLKGVGVYPGIVKGKVKIIFGKKDLKKIKRGNILVAIFAMPYYLPAFKKASAVVTDEGGLLSHASIMARELKKPCIIGTKIATKVLKDGDLVEVDANKGVVKIISREKDEIC